MRNKFIVVVLWSLPLWPASGVYSAVPMPREAALPQPTTTSAPSQPTVPAVPTVPTEPAPDAAGTEGPDFRLEFGDRPGAGASGVFYRMLAYTMVILVLAGAGLFVVKRVLPKISSRPGKSVSVLETVYLGPKKTLHLLQVGSQRFLVAGARDQICLLGEVSSAFAGGNDSAAAPAEAAGFASILKGQDGSDADADQS